MKKTFLLVAVALLGVSSAFGQLRPKDKTGINVFENPKPEEEFDGMKVAIGGAFDQGFQAINQSNKADLTDPNNKLMKLDNGFTLASANMDIRAYLSDGITVNLEVYLASRHHNDTWVKGGYIQIDKVPFMKSDLLDQLMYFTTVKIGQMDVNYGDSHFRRSDGGHAMFNPFVENYIMDAFATEIGAEVILRYGNITAVGSLTNGLLKPELAELNVSETSKSNGERNPAWIGKLAYDKQFTNDFRMRASGSIYHTKGSGSNTLYSGDRTGSHYFGVMSKDGTQTTSESSFTTGRYNPGYGDKVTSMMANLFLKYKGLEWFSTLERAKGRGLEELEARTTDQFATDLVYRFGGEENFWVGARFNAVKGEIASQTDDIKINRFAASAGWFPTKNLMTKLEYVNQTYDGFPTTNILHEGKFSGLVLQAAIAF